MSKPAKPANPSKPTNIEDDREAEEAIKRRQEERERLGTDTLKPLRIK